MNHPGRRYKGGSYSNTKITINNKLEYEYIVQLAVLPYTALQDKKLSKKNKANSTEVSNMLFLPHTNLYNIIPKKIYIYIYIV